MRRYNSTRAHPANWSSVRTGISPPSSNGCPLDRGDPFGFVLGRGAVIRGWDEGVKGMKEDGKRTLVIPSDMAYGNRGAGGLIPPGATLRFDVELIGVK